MNCKPGDLAVVRPGHPNAGRIVHVLEYLGRAESVRTGKVFDDVWLVERGGKRIGALGYRLGVSDAFLRPIRDQPGADETLTWKPVPQPVPEKEQA